MASVMLLFAISMSLMIRFVEKKIDPKDLSKNTATETDEKVGK